MPVSSLYTSIAVFLFSAFALIVPSGMAAGALMLTLGSIVLLWKRAGARLQRDEWMVAGVFLLYFLICALTNWVHDEQLREYDVPLRFVLAVPALFLVVRYPPALAAFWGGLAGGANGAGFLALWEKFVIDAPRASGFTNPIQYGNISMVLGVLCLAGLGWAATRRHARWWIAALVAGAAIGIVGSFLTGSRGSWVALPACLFLLYRHYGRTVRKRYLLGGVLVVAVALSGVYAIPQAGMHERMQDAVEETDGYFVSGNANTSVGARFEMWRTAMMLFPENPFLGWGKTGFLERKQALISEGKVAAFTGDHTHSHNEYLDALIKRGLLGLANLLILYGTLLFVFWRRLVRGDTASRPYTLSGLLLVISYVGFGLTQAFLTHNNGAMTLVFLVVILLSLSRSKAIHETAR